MRRGAFSLTTFSLAVRRVDCARSERSGRYRLSSLLARFGGDTALLDVLEPLASCDRRAHFSMPCGAKLFVLIGQPER